MIPGGIIYLLVFSKKDPWFLKVKELNLRLGLKSSEKNTFYLPKAKIYRHFFTKSEIKNLLASFQIIFLREMKVKDKSHNRPHFHYIFEVLAKKNKLRAS